MATRAVIDIGTNSVKLLVAEVSQGRVDPLFEGSEQTRLGAGFYETHRLGAKPIQKTAEAVRGFVEKAEAFGLESLHIVGTSAVRDAENAQELIGAVGREVAVITGEQEADWAFAGVASDSRLGKEPLMVMDIGGGSTEFVFGAHGERRAGRSFKIGSVRLLEKFPPSDPPTETEREKCLVWLREFFAAEVRPFLEEHLNEPAMLITTGGTGSILGRLKWKLTHYDREKIEATVFGARELADWTWKLWSLPLEERRRLPGMPASRADVIIMGAAILKAGMEALRFSEVRISTRGLRYGALLHVEKSGSI